MPKFIPKNIDFIVCSGGGAGTTMLLDYFSQIRSVNCPNDYDNLKHMPIPPVSFNKNMKCIFVYSNPVDTCISLFNRNFHSWQSRKLCRFTESSEFIPQNFTLKSYAQQSRDLLRLECQFNNYFEKYILYPTLFLKYELIWDSLPVIKEFLDLREDEIQKFPSKYSRKSSKENFSPEIYEMLKKNIYNDFLIKTESLSPAHVRSPSGSFSLGKIFTSINFRLAIKNGICNFKKNKSFIYGE